MMARAYGAYYGPANVLKVPAILGEMAHFGLPLPTADVRLLDVGCGPATASAGAAWWWKERGVAVSTTGLDWSAEFLSLGSAVMGALGARFQTKKADWSQAGVLVSAVKESRPHIVVASNALNEVRREPADLAALWTEVLADLALNTKRDKEPRYLILLEPGSRDASRRLLQMRSALLDKMPAGAALVLPCLDARPCGALVDAKDWCHEDVAVTMPAWHEELGKAAGLFKESLIFSYLVFAVLPEGVPAAFPTGGSRVVSQRMEEKGLTKCFVCTASQGKRQARVLNARRSPENETLATCHRGQVFTTLELSEKGDVNQAAPRA
jgi:ribosomal protein RSM22 (predicted rRNA methylase)